MPVPKVAYLKLKQKKMKKKNEKNSHLEHAIERRKKERQRDGKDRKIEREEGCCVLLKLLLSYWLLQRKYSD